MDHVRGLVSVPAAVPAVGGRGEGAVSQYSRLGLVRCWRRSGRSWLPPENIGYTIKWMKGSCAFSAVVPPDCMGRGRGGEGMFGRWVGKSSLRGQGRCPVAPLSCPGCFPIPSLLLLSDDDDDDDDESFSCLSCSSRAISPPLPGS